MLAQRLKRFGRAAGPTSSPVWRRSALLVAALAGALGLLATWARPLPPADESTLCSGTVEAALAQVLRLLPGVPVASVLNGFTAPLILLAFAFLGGLLHLASGSAILALAGTLGVAWSPAAPPPLAPAAAIAIGATACALAAFRSNHWASSRPIVGAAAVTGACAVLVLALPAFVLPMTVLVVTYLWCERSRLGPRFVALGAVAWSAAAVSAVLAAAHAISPGLSAEANATAGWACVVPPFGAAAPTVWPAAVGTAIRSVGPLPFALAGAGLVAGVWGGHARWLMALACAAAAALAAAGGHVGGPVDLLMPLVVAFWCLVAMGMRAVVDWSTGRTRAVLALLLIGLVPLLQLAHRQTPTAPASAQSTRVAQLSTNEFWYLVRALPDGAIVREDRTTDMLFRAIAPRLRRAGRALTVIPAEADRVRAAMGSAPVFALPLRQADLRNRGFVLREDQTPAGVAEVVDSWPCADLTAAWRVSPELTRTTRFALVSEGPAIRGPVVALFGYDEPPDAWPFHWPERTTRGFRSQTYDLGREPVIRKRLREDGVPPGALVDSPYIQRLVLWRTPDAPLMLPVALRHRPTAVLARLAPEAEASGLRLCPVPDGP